MTKISVIIPIYNVEKYVSTCLDSLLRQTYQDLEIICVDDCSTDGTLNVLKAYAEKDTRIKILKNEVNSGAATSRNNGLDVATGEYVYFIDSDDWIDDDYLEKMLSAIEKAGTDIVLNLNVETNGAKYIHPTMKSVAPEGEFVNQKDAIENAPVFIWARLYRKSFLNKYNLRYISIKKCNDVPFHFITQIHVDKIFVFYGPAYHYVSRNDSITGTGKQQDDRDFWVMSAYDQTFDYLKQNNIFTGDIKLFSVWPHYKVDTTEKFALYKSFFNKIKPILDKTRDIYNELELFFADMILNSNTFEDYKSKYNPSVTMSFIRRKK